MGSDSIMMDLSAKNVLVTGAASGIGRLIATKMAARGAHVVLWDLNDEGLRDLEKTLESGPGSALSYHCDLSDPGAIQETAKEVTARVGPLDVLVNNAGIVTGKTLLEASEEEIRRTFAINTLALFWTTRAFLPAMLEANRGRIVTIASAGGIVGTPRMTDYCASKFAAVGFDEALRLELRHQGKAVTTTVVCPYYVNTGMFAGVKTRFPWLLPILEPEQVAERVVQAVVKGRRRVLMPWFVYAVYPTRLLPIPWFDGVMGFFGINRSMDEFTGRGNEPTS